MGARSSRSALDGPIAAKLRARATVEGDDKVKQVLRDLVVFIGEGRAKAATSHGVVGCGQGVLVTSGDRQLMAALMSALTAAGVGYSFEAGRIIIGLPSALPDYLR